MIKKLLNGISEALKSYAHFWSQRMSHIGYLIPDLVWDSNFVIEIARTQEDLEAIFRLQHESYLSRGLMKPQASGLRCTIYHFLPQTNHIVVKYKNLLIASMTLVADSPLGLPAEKYFTDEINQLRKTGEETVELSSFVVEKGFQGWSEALAHLLMKYALNYVKKYMGSEQVILNVHPQVAKSFCKNWYFRKKSEVIRFHSAKSAQTVLLARALDGKSQNYFSRSFSSLQHSKNTAAFIALEDSRFRYPGTSEGQIMHPVMTPDLLQYFFLKRTNLYEDLDLATRQIFLEMYLQFFGEGEIEIFLNLERDMTLKEFRIPISSRAAVQVGQQVLLGRVRDVTARGCFVEVPNEILGRHTSLSLSFKLGAAQVRVSGRTSWQNNQLQLRYGHGYGVRFDQQIQEVQSEIRNWLPLRRAS